MPKVKIATADEECERNLALATLSKICLQILSIGARYPTPAIHLAEVLVRYARRLFKEDFEELFDELYTAALILFAAYQKHCVKFDGVRIHSREEPWMEIHDLLWLMRENVESAERKNKVNVMIDFFTQRYQYHWNKFSEHYIYHIMKSPRTN